MENILKYCDLCLVRHGQTDWNVRKMYQGHTDIPLNKTGLKQAKDLAKQLVVDRFDAVYSSDLQRAYITARIIADALGLQVNTDRRLREICQGEWEGKTLDEVRETYASHFEQEKRDMAHARAPGGESVGEVADRMRAAVEEIARKHTKQHVLIVSHGLALATIICHINNVPLEQVYRQIPDNSAPVRIRWQTLV